MILLVNHPAGFLDALILAATFDREVRCLVDRKMVRNPLERLLAKGLEMILYEAGGEDWASALAVSCDALAGGCAVITFAEPQAPQTAGPPRFFGPRRFGSKTQSSWVPLAAYCSGPVK